ncbi:MAG TPA: hypothetical protein VNK52_02700 [Hyphomicrobiaceae bacterium]|nr:hypothetical protein [Hyphomicrobiaceae bacterium]
MAKPELIWPGERMRAFFRAVLARETVLDGLVRERLVDALCAPVNRMLVWRNPADEAVAAPSGLDARRQAASQEAERPAAMAPSPDPERSAEPAAERAFDPYGFSVVAIFTQGGRAALMERLTEIRAAEHLRALAHAQHLAIPKEATGLEALREAIVKGAEQRIADRRAAAS